MGNRSLRFNTKAEMILFMIVGIAFAAIIIPIAVIKQDLELIIFAASTLFVVAVAVLGNLIFNKNKIQKNIRYRKTPEVVRLEEFMNKNITECHACKKKILFSDSRCPYCGAANKEFRYTPNMPDGDPGVLAELEINELGEKKDLLVKELAPLAGLSEKEVLTKLKSLPAKFEVIFVKSGMTKHEFEALLNHMQVKYKLKMLE